MANESQNNFEKIGISEKFSNQKSKYITIRNSKIMVHTEKNQ